MTDQLNDPLAELFSRADLDLATIHAPAYADVRTQGRRRRLRTRVGLAATAAALVALAAGAPAGIGHLRSDLPLPPATKVSDAAAPAWDYRRDLGTSCSRAVKGASGRLGQDSLNRGARPTGEPLGSALPPNRWLLAQDLVLSTTPDRRGWTPSASSMPTSVVDRTGRSVGFRNQPSATSWGISPSSAKALATQFVLVGPEGLGWSDSSMALTMIWGAEYGSERDARQAFTSLTTQLECGWGYARPTVTAAGDVVLTKPALPSGLIPIQLFHGSGRVLLQVETLLAPEAATTVPAPLNALVRAAVTRTTGKAVVPLPIPWDPTIEPHVIPLPDTFLLTTDLGGTWTTSGLNNDRIAQAGYSRLLPGCGATAGVTVSGPMHSQLYRGEYLDATKSNARLVLTEVVATLSPSQARAARAALTAAATCSDFRSTPRADQPTLKRLAGSTDGPVVVEGVQPAGKKPSYATVYTMAGDSLIVLDTMPGGPSSGALPPRSLEWLLATARTAAERATK